MEQKICLLLQAEFGKTDGEHVWHWSWVFSDHNHHPIYAQLGVPCPSNAA